MADGGTTMVEIRTDLLEALRELYPGSSDREILEGLVRAYLLRRDVRAKQARSGLPEEEASRVARAIRSALPLTAALPTRSQTGPRDTLHE